MGKRLVFNEAGKPVKPVSKPTLKDLTETGEKAFRKPQKANGTTENYSKQLIREEGQKWFEHGFNEVRKTEIKHDDETYLNQLKRAQKLLARELEIGAKSSGHSDEVFLEKMIEKGTMGDRLSAIQLRVQQSPLHSLNVVKNLVDFFEKKKMRDSVNILKSLKEIFAGELLPSDRKLVNFDKRPLDKVDQLSSGNGSETNRRLIYWLFEQEVKKLYARVVEVTQRLTTNQVEGVAVQTVLIIAKLLAERPEQEQVLLSSLIQKIGHPKKKVAVTACEQVGKVVEAHPNMRVVVIDELERLIFRKNIAERTQFYAIHTLYLIPIRPGDADVAIKLLKIYFSMFRILILKKSTSARLLTSVIRGANRAFPYAKDRGTELGEQLDDLYKVVHSATKVSTSLSALKLLFQMLSYNSGLSDRFYAAFYQRMITIRSTKADIQFFDLTFKVLKADPIEERVHAIIKRLLQLALVNTPAFAAATLILYNSLLSLRPNIIQLVKHADKTISVKNGAPAPKRVFNVDDEEERYHDVPDGDEPNKKITENGDGPHVNGYKMENGEEKPILNGKSKKGWVHTDLVSAKVRERMANMRYDPNARNPLFAHAEFTVDSELHVLSQHYHPTVALFARNLVDGIPITYKGNALIDFTLIRFLDRFAFKNPKIRQAEDGKFKGYVPHGSKRLSIISKEYASRQSNEIGSDEKFLHRFATLKMKQEALKAEKKEEDDFDDGASVASDEFDQLLEQMEPGEKNDVFDIDFTKAFGKELSEKEAKAKRKEKRRNADALDEIDDSDDDEDGVGGEDSDLDFDSEDESEDGEERAAAEDSENDDEEDEADGDSDVDDDEDSGGDDDMDSDDEAEFKPKNLKKLKKRGFQDDSDDEEDVAAKAFDIGSSLSYLQDAEAAVDQLDDLNERQEQQSNKRKRKIFKPKVGKRVKRRRT